MTELRQIKLTFLGEPVPKAAIKHIFSGGKMHGFKPPKTQNAINDIRSQLQSQLPGSWTAIEGPIEATVVFRKIRPTSNPNRIYPHTRPDLDNLLKLFWDALNGIVFKDDAQVVSINAKKEFGDIAGIDAELRELPVKKIKERKRRISNDTSATVV